MASRVTAAQLETPQTARFLTLAEPLRDKAVRDLFSWVLAQNPGSCRVGHEFLKPQVPGAAECGFVLLVERRHHRSAFVSACRERDARPVVICQP